MGTGADGLALRAGEPRSPDASTPIAAAPAGGSVASPAGRTADPAPAPPRPRTVADLVAERSTRPRSGRRAGSEAGDD